MSAASVLAKGKVALITGSASGIGLAIAHRCHAKGMKLALVDNNKTLLSKAKEALGEAAETYEMDVSKAEQWEELRENVKRKYGRVDLLCLNAGIALKGGWDDSTYFRKIMDVNLFGQINGLNTFVPLMKGNTTPSSIVMTGSKQGITNPPGNPAYNASKAAVKSLAEHLSFDLRDTPISVHLLVPGWAFTGLSGGHPGSTKEKPAGAWKPEQVAEYLEKKMSEDQFYVICPDNDVTEDLDKRRMLYSTGDAVYGRKPMSRWREDSKQDAEEKIKGLKI